MTSPFDAEDMMKRSFLSSIMALKKKKPPPQVAAPTSRRGTVVQDDATMTQQAIFQEIVCECGQLEGQRPRASTFASCSFAQQPPQPQPNHVQQVASPQSTSFQQPIPYDHSPAPLPNEAVPSPCYRPMPQFAPFPPSPSFDVPHHRPMHLPPPPAMCHYEGAPAMFGPPPYSPLPMYPPYPSPPPPHPASAMPMKQEAMEVKPFSLDEVVRLVVNALRDSGITDTDRESPEAILRRKREQNNQAAARYRKRQRDARDKAHDELSVLAKRNDELRDAVGRMEREIASLKESVMEGGGTP